MRFPQDSQEKKRNSSSKISYPSGRAESGFSSFFVHWNNYGYDSNGIHKFGHTSLQQNSPEQENKDSILHGSIRLLGENQRLGRNRESNLFEPVSA